MQKFGPVILLLLVFTLSGCGTPTSNEGEAIYEELPQLPYGYEYIDVSAFGKSFEQIRYYCQSKSNPDAVYYCWDGKLTDRLYFQDGYTFHMVSSFGESFEQVSFYCRLKNVEPARIFRCKPTEVIPVE